MRFSRLPVLALARARAPALLLAAFAGAALLAPAPAKAMSSEERDATFWKVAVIDFIGRTPVTDGATAGVRFAASLRNSRRFHVIDPPTVRKAVRNSGADVSTGQLSEADAKKICKELKVDGIFTGRVEKAANGGALTIALYSAASGNLFAQYKFPMTAEFPLTEAAKDAAGFTDRLPYDGLVVSLRRDLSLINLGAANGLATGSKVYGFAMEKEGERRLLSELEVVRVEQHGSWVRASKGDQPEEFLKISVRPVAGVENLKPAVISSSSAVPYINLEVDADLGFIVKSYSLSGTSNALPTTFKSNTTLSPAPGFHVAYFPGETFGVDFAMRYGFIPFHQAEGSGVTARQVVYNGSVSQVIPQIQIRKMMQGSGFFGGGALVGGIGVDYLDFQIQSQQTTVLTNDRYLGPLISGGLRVPFLDLVTVRSGIGVVPFATLTQTPLNNGTGSVFGGRGTLGLDYHVSDTLFVSADYGIDYMSTTFPSAGGSRKLSDPKQTDLYHGLTLSFGYRSYK